MLEVLKNGRLQVRKKFGLIGKRLGWIEDECSIQKTPTASVTSQPISWKCAKVATDSVGPQTDQLAPSENFLTIFENVFSSF